MKIDNGIGMTMRDYFAVKAMAAYINGALGEQSTKYPEFFAAWAYRMADEMLKERSKNES